MHTFKSTLRLGISVLLIACSTYSYGQNVAAAQPNLAHVAANTPTSTNTISNASAATSQLILGPADVIRINVWKNTDLSQTGAIGPDGFISLSLLGDVHVAGMTSNQLAQELKSKLASPVVSAQVTVSVVDIRSRHVYMTGQQVGKPGGYPLIAPITVLQLIAQAGGLNTFANRKEIVILRNVGGSVQWLRLNYNSAVHGDPKQNISLSGGRYGHCSLMKRMKRSGHLRCATALFAGLCSGTLLAQSSGERVESSSADTPHSTVSNVDDTARTSREVSSQEPQYAAALNGAGLISMDDVGKRVLLSTTVGGGWDSNPSNATNGGSSGVYSVSPYIGFRGASPKTQYLVQYQPTTLGHMSNLYTRQTLHRSSASFIGNPSERWKWGSNGSGSYGPNGTRLLVSQQTVVVGEVPGTGAGSALYL